MEGTATQAFIVIREDELLYEGYFGDFERDSIATSSSTSKSYLSALVGIAIGEGAIGSPDDPITDYLPELLARDERFRQITIQHLLDMASGIRYEENGFITGDDALTYYYDDLRALALERTEIDGPPGERWHYNNYHPLLLGLVLERSTGMPVADYLSERLWGRIGAEFPASWSLGSDDGFEKLESGINARPIDFAKLGSLYLNGGAWGGQQVVPPDWVSASTSAAETVDHAAYYPPWMGTALRLGQPPDDVVAHPRDRRHPSLLGRRQSWTVHLRRPGCAAHHRSLRRTVRHSEHGMARAVRRHGGGPGRIDPPQWTPVGECVHDPVGRVLLLHQDRRASGRPMEPAHRARARPARTPRLQRLR